MNKQSISGMKSVFLFTIAQNFKSKGIKVITILLVLLMLFSMPLMHYFDQKGIKKETFSVDTVYVLDETGLDLGDFSDMKKTSEKYQNVTFKNIDKSKELSKDELQITVVNADNNFVFQFIVPSEGGISEADINESTQDFISFFKQLRIDKLGISKEKNASTQATVEKNVSFLNEQGLPIAEEKGISMEQYYAFIGIIVLLVFLISFSAETVSSSIVTEKSSKLVENLLLCVKPIVLIVGKVAGALGTVFIQVSAMIISFVISAFLAKNMYDLEKLVFPSQINSFLSQMKGISPIKIIIALSIIFLGVLFFALFAALFGAAVSRIEDMTEGMKVYNVLLILGAYSGMGLNIAQLSGGGYKMIQMILSVIPLSAPFIVPMKLLMGEISIGTALFVCVVMIAFIILLTVFVSRVYQAMILYKGDVIKFKRMIQLGKGGETL